MEVMQNRFCVINYYDTEQLIEMITKPESSGMKDEDFKQMMLDYALIVEKYKSPKLLLNTAASAFIVTPDLQDWVAQTIAPRTIGAGQRRSATVISKDIFAAIAIEQMMEDIVLGENDRFITKYFDDAESARAWLHAQ
jgi:hypothetical protein